MKNTILTICLLTCCVACTPHHSDLCRVTFPDSEITIDNYSLQLPSPDSLPNIGLAGLFSGVIDGTLVIGGGANFPNGLPKDNGKKVWHNTVYTFDGEVWQVFKNAMPTLAYGISVTLPNGILCIGGNNSEACSSDCFLLTLKGRIPVFEPFPPLPVPISCGAGAKAGHYVFVAGGQETMQDYAATKNFFILDLDSTENGWRSLPAWDGGARGYSVAIGTDSCFYLLSGRDYDKDENWTVWTDGFVYHTHLQKWEKLNAQFPVMAGCGVAIDNNHLLLMGGRSPRSNVGENFVHLYDITQDTLSTIDLHDYILPVTTSLCQYGDSIYICSGEIAPGVRTPAVYQVKVKK